jgi:hypothetical protein
MLDNIVYSSHIYANKMMSTFPPRSSQPKLAGAIRRFLPRKRDREVPYGMKGGELDGRKEKGW